MNSPKPCTPKQQAFLAYLGHGDMASLSAAEVSRFLDEAKEKVKYHEAFRRWEVDKLRLHPELYKRDIGRRRAARAHSIFEHCEMERMNHAAINASGWPLKKLNERVCHEVVAWLDAGYAGWDAELWDADEYWGVSGKVVQTYFVPAVANVAPDFIRKEKTGNAAGLEKAREARKQAAPQAAASNNPTKSGEAPKGGCAWLGAILVFLFGVGVVWLVMALK